MQRKESGAAEAAAKLVSDVAAEMVDLPAEDEVPYEVSEAGGYNQLRSDPTRFQGGLAGQRGNTERLKAFIADPHPVEEAPVPSMTMTEIGNAGDAGESYEDQVARRTAEKLALSKDEWAIEDEAHRAAELESFENYADNEPTEDEAA